MFSFLHTPNKNLNIIIAHIIINSIIDTKQIDNEAGWVMLMDLLKYNMTYDLKSITFL